MGGDPPAATAPPGATTTADETKSSAPSPPTPPGSIQPADPNEMQPQVRELLAKARAATVQYPDSPESWGQWGRVCDAHKLFDCAERCYRRARELAPDDFTFPYLLASVLDFSGRGGDESIKLYEEAARLNPRYAQIYWRLGFALDRQGKLAEARDAYLKAVKIDPKFAMAHRAAGQALLALGDVKVALSHLERAARLSPEDGAVHAALAQAYRRSGDTERARQEAELAKGREPTYDIADPVRDMVRQMAVDSVSAYSKALQFVDDNRYADAIPFLKVAESANPSDPLVQIYLGTAYHRTGQPEAALRHLQAAIALDASRGPAYLELGSLYLDLGRMEEADAAYKKVDELNPRNGAVHVFMADGFMQRGELYRANKAWETASLYKILDAGEMSRWGATLLGMGDVDKAIERFNVSVALKPDFEEGWHNLGVALEHAGRVGEAIVAHQRALEINPNGASAQRLEMLQPRKP